MCSVHSCEARGQTQRSTKRFYLLQRVSEERRPSWNVQPGRGRCNWQMYNTEFNSPYAKCSDPLQPFSCFFRCRLTFQTAALNKTAPLLCRRCKSPKLPSLPLQRCDWREARWGFRCQSRAWGWSWTFSSASFTICSSQKNKRNTCWCYKGLKLGS